MSHHACRSVSLRFNDIVFVGSTLYVATDNGVMVSKTAGQWLVPTDNTGERPIINNFAVDGSKVYGVSDVGVYRLNTHNQWKQVLTDVPGGLVSLAITNDRLYGATDQVDSAKENGMFYISLEENEEK